MEKNPLWGDLCAITDLFFSTITFERLKVGRRVGQAVLYTVLSNTCESYCADAWICVRQTTDRDLVRVSAMKR